MRFLFLFGFSTWVVLGCNNNEQNTNKKNKFGPPASQQSSSASKTNHHSKSNSSVIKPEKTIALKTKMQETPTIVTNVNKEGLGTLSKDPKAPPIQDADLNNLQKQVHAARKELEKELGQ